MNSKKRLIIIDGNSLMNRAYYAMQHPMITKEGIFTQGIYGFINMLNKILTDFYPEYLCIAFDRKSPTFRHKEYTEYKANRKKTPDELSMQFPILKEVLQARNICMFEKDGFEADDIIGTIAKQGEDAGLAPLIVTGDKDALQLATDTTKVLITKRGITDFDLYDKNKMIEVYDLTPTQFIDLKGLMGDSSDNIPGVPGIGEKTGQKLLSQFGSIENIYDNISEVANDKLRQKLIDNSHLANMSKMLATIDTNVPIDIEWDTLKLKEINYDLLLSLYTKLEFNKFMQSLRNDMKEQGINTTASTRVNAPQVEVTESPVSALVQSQNLNDAPKDSIDDYHEDNTKIDDIKELLDNIPTVKIKELNRFKIESISDFDDIPFDIDSSSSQHELSESTKLVDSPTPFADSIAIKVFCDKNHKTKPSVYGIAFVINNTFYYLDNCDQSMTEKFVDKLNNSKVSIIGHDIKEDMYVLSMYGLTSFNCSFDTSIAKYLLDPTRSTYDLDAIAFEYLRIKMDESPDFSNINTQIDLFSSEATKYENYAYDFLNSILNLIEPMKKELEDEGLTSLFKNVELPLIEVLTFVQKEGFKINKNTLKEIGTKLREEITKLENEIYALSEKEFNINSPIQLANILFEDLKIPYPAKKKSGKYSTNADILKKLEHSYPIVTSILAYRTLSKLNSTYIEGLFPLINEDDKVHAHFMQTVTATGRISCVEPNLQNIPIKQAQGREIRKAFIPHEEGDVLIGADYSQIELRVLAHVSADENLITAFNDNQDIHKLTAARVLGIPMDEVTSSDRRMAKAINFGIIYGMSGFGLSEELATSPKEGEQYISDYFSKHTSVKKYMDEQVEFCKNNGYVKTIMGRKRFIPEINSSNYIIRQLGVRLAMNTPIQGSAADIIKIAMINVYNELRKNNYRSRLILQVHDELIINVKKDELEDVKELLITNMRDAAALNVKLATDVNIGNTWYELK